MSRTQFDDFYTFLIRRVLAGTKELNQRTGVEVFAIPNQTINLDMSSGLIPVTNMRRMYTGTAAAETAWTLLGEKKLDWLQKYTKIWDKFANEQNEIEAAYGHRWQEAFGRNQLLDAISTLNSDPSNRQVVIMAWDAGKDGLGNYYTSNVPCPIGFILNVIDNKLNMTVMLRSSDVMVGLPYDTMMYAFLFYAIANSLKVGYGTLTMYLAHAHIYACHEEMAREMLTHKFTTNYSDTKQEVYAPKLSVEEIIANPDLYVEYVKNQKDQLSLSEKVFTPEVVA